MKYDDVRYKTSRKERFFCGFFVATCVVMSVTILWCLYTYYDPEYIKQTELGIVVMFSPSMMALGIMTGKYLVYKHYLYKYEM
jgi:hypothetical protein